MESLLQVAISEFTDKSQDEQAKLVFSYFGLAIYWAQCIEQTFENMLILNKIAKKEKITKEYVDLVFEKIEKSRATMGWQINEIKQVYSISNNHEQQLKSVLAKRNYLAHKFFKVNSFKFLTKEGKLELIKECANFIEKTKYIDNELTIYVDKLMKKLGISAEFIQNEMEKAEKEEYGRVKRKQEQTRHSPTNNNL